MFIYMPIHAGRLCLSCSIVVQGPCYGPLVVCVCRACLFVQGPCYGLLAVRVCRVCFVCLRGYLLVRVRSRWHGRPHRAPRAPHPRAHVDIFP